MQRWITIPKQTYFLKDFITVLDNKPIKTQLVKPKLISCGPVYEKIHIDWVKQVLKKLLNNGLVQGGIDENFGGYVWYIQDELKYNPEDFIQVLGKRFITTQVFLERLNKPVKMARKYSKITPSVADELLKSLLEEGLIDGMYDTEQKGWKWRANQE